MRSKKRKKICLELAAFFGNRCFYCTRSFEGEAIELRTLDHLIPISRGGTHAIENLVLSCRKCNNCKADMTYEEYIATELYARRLAWGIHQAELKPKRPKFKVEFVTTLAV